jgi:hypothetical protein
MALEASGTTPQGLRNLSVGAVAIGIEFTSNNNGDTVEITFYEDTDNDGKYENTETVTVSNGQSRISPTNLELIQGNELYWKVSAVDGDSDVTTALANLDITINY